MKRIKKVMLLLVQLIALEECVTFMAAHYFFEIEPSSVSLTFALSFLVLVMLNWHTKRYKTKDFFKLTHLLLMVVLLFWVVLFRAGFVWALNTFPLRDANTVLLTLQEPFDDFAYGMVKMSLATIIPQTLVITAILTVFLYTILNSTRKRLVAVGAYFVATIVALFSDIPVLNYIQLLKGDSTKNDAYSEFFIENYADPDSVKITPPDQKRNLILIYLESLETTFADKEHGGNQDFNLIPEITELALENLNFGRNGKHIGGGHDIRGSASTFSAMISRSLGIPDIVNYKNTLVLHRYKSLYKILDECGYKQIFFQGNPGLYEEFKDYVIEQKVDEVYGPDDIAQRLNLDHDAFMKKQGFKNVQDKDAFRFAGQILDTISEPFSLTFFTIDTHSPHGFYDSDCIKVVDENNKDELLKASIQCVSRELNKFIVSLKSKPFYENTAIVIFGDHLFMGKRLVESDADRKWVDVFLNTPKPISGEKRLFSDVDMFPTILSSMNFDVVGNKLGLGTNLFSDRKTLVERMGLDSLNKEINKMPNHLIYESYLLKMGQKGM